MFLLSVKGTYAKKVREAFAEVFSEIHPEMKQFKTYDRGVEMTKHNIVTEPANVKSVLCRSKQSLTKGVDVRLQKVL